MAARIGPFVLTEQLGQGGCGTVWRARHAGERFDVAVKVVNARSEEARAAFHAEVHAVARLDHPNVVTVYDTGALPARTAAALGLEPGHPWLAMELARTTLRDALPTLGWPERLRVLDAVLAALAHAHARGVIHRDLKPGNVLLDARSADVVLADFGLAFALGDEAPTRVSGTPPYMAPEQVRGRADAFGPWTDLYAVGCIAYLLAAGHPPFGRARSEVLRAHLADEPPPLPPGAAPDGYEDWVRVLLRKDPAARFQRAADALAALARIGPARRPPPASVDPDATTVVAELDPLPAAAPPSAAAPPPPAAIPTSWRPAVRAPNPDAHELVVGLGLVGLRDPPFVGREAERDQLWAELLAVAGGAARAVVIRGPAGRGRRRLAGWLAERAHEVGAAEVFQGEPDPEGDPLLALALRGQVALPPGVIDRLGPHATVLGRLADGLPVPPAARAEAILQAIRALAGPRIPLVVLHEVQDAPDALALAEEAVRRGLPILWVLTRRTDRPGDPLPDGFRPIDLPPLAPDEHRALLRGLLPLAPSVAARVHDRTGGEPAFTVQLLRAWIDRGWLARRPGGYRLAVPDRQALVPDLAGVWRDRLRALLERRPASARRALELAAALGRHVLVKEWEAACAEAGVEVPAGLVAALAQGGLVELAPDGFRFRHAALPDAVLADAAAPKLVHRACARALAARGAPGLRLARHLLLAEDWEEVIPVLRTSGARAAYLGRLDQSVWAAEARARALDALGVPEHDVRRFELDRDRADVARALGDLAEAERLGLRAIERARRHGFPLANVLSGHGMLMLIQGRDAEAERWLREALAASVVEGNDGQRAYTLRALARVVALHDLAEATAMVEESLAICRRDREAKGTGYSHLLAADLLDRQGRLAEARQASEQALAVFSAEGMATAVAQARQVRGQLALHQGDLDRAEEDLRTALDAILGDHQAEWYLAGTHLAWVELLRGRLATADRMFARAEEQARRAGSRAALPPILLGQLSIAARQGRWDLWERLHGELLEVLRAVPIDPRYARYLRHAAAAGAPRPEALEEIGRRLA